MATVSVGSFERLLANGVKLVGSAVPIPMTAEGVRDMLLSEAGLAPEVATNLNLADPLPRSWSRSTTRGAAASCWRSRHGPAEKTEKLIAALGKPVVISGPLTKLVDATGKARATGPGPWWSWVTRWTRWRAEPCALEARHTSSDDATTTIYPEAIARAHGTDMTESTMALFDQMRQMQTARRPPS